MLKVEEESKNKPQELKELKDVDVIVIPEKVYIALSRLREVIKT